MPTTSSIREMNLTLELQLASDTSEIPAEADFNKWALAVLKGRLGSAEVVIRVVDEEESQRLNRDFRDKDKATNVLSFPFEVPAQVESTHIGDLVICAPVVIREAAEQQKPAADHWAHMVVHGLLHLLGYDHQDEEEAEEMESLERVILGSMGITDPY